MSRWYLIHTKPLCEEIARRNLERQRYATYLPRLLQQVRRQGVLHEQVSALFPRYLFLHLEEGLQSLGPVHSTIGVSRVVRFGARFAVIPEQLIGDLRAREDPQSGLHRCNARARLAAGVPVTITCGPLDGLEGIFERHAGAERVVVLLKILGHNASVCVSADAVVASRAA